MSSKTAKHATVQAELPPPVEAPKPFDYLFTDAERTFFQQHIDAIHRANVALGNATSLICTQQNLQGHWQVTPDGTGLTQIKGNGKL